MNPSYPGPSGHGPPLGGNKINNTTISGPSLPPPPPQQHSFHAQQPSSLNPLPHPGHSGLHPLHGGGSNLLHSSGIPPPLPPPPLPTSTLGQGNSGSSRSPHHSLSNSILHPPRGPVGLSGTGNTNSTTNAPTLMGKPLMNGSLGSGGSGNNNTNGGNPSTSSLMNHTVRLPSTQSGGGGGGGGMKSSPSIPSFSGGLRPPPISPPRSIPHGLQQPPPSSSSATSSSSSNQPSTQPPPPSSSTASAQTHYETESEGIYFTTPSMNMGSTPPPRHRELRVEDALLYLDQVKQQFGDQPDIYNQFLDVMKDFKAQSIDTPGVILRVSSLFRGYPNLILGFNTFLPPGYRIRPDTSIEVMYQPTSGRGPSPMSGTSGGNSGTGGGNNGGYGPPPSVHRPPPVSIPPPLSPPKQSSSSNRPLTQSSKSGPTHPSSSKKKNYVAPPSSGVGSHPIATAMRGNTSNPVEFDHAIHYVTTIKQRFSEEPETYKEFLAILHTYQKEQRSIRQVLDQVSYLFRDHPDLLREFTFFLPDAVQEQAKERLNRAAEKAQQRKDALHRSSKASRRPSSSDDWRRGNGGGAGGTGGTSPSLSGSSGGMKGRESLEMEGSGRGKSKKGGDASGKQRVSPHDPSKDRQKAMFNHKRNAAASSTAGKRRHGASSYHDSKERRSFLALSDVLIDSNEWGIFEKIKKILPSRDSWREFLKCLELYAQEVLGRKEMMSLIRNLCGRHESIITEFDQLLLSHGEEEEDSNEIWPFIPLAETDLSQCRRATPSYRALPSNYPIPPCSYRSSLEKQLCNDSWVSVPTGSEDFSFKNMRKNQYEEALFKCEDERFEIDMVIDANAQTISVLTPLLQEISILKEEGIEEKLFSYRLDKNTLRITHLNAISRIYGESGSQILELLRAYPAGTIPIIYQRLLQKDKEWRQARQDLNKQWKEVNEKNYHKSLDHSSFYFKQKDKKQTSCKQLIQDIKQAKGLTYSTSAIQIHKDVYHLLSYAVEKHCNEKEKVAKVWQSFLFPFLYLPQEWFMQQPIKQTTLTLETSKDVLRPGTRVRTDFGDGIVQSFDAKRGICMVQLSMGQGYLQPHAITIEERMTDFPSTIEVLDDVKDSNELKSIVFGNTHMYVLLRLYQLLHARLEKAFELCEKAKRNRHRRTVNPAARALDHARSTSTSSISSSSGVTTGDYQMFISKLYALIDGSLDPVKYEDGCRTLMGSTSYFLFTMDKLVQQVSKQMQQVATDETCQELIALYTSRMQDMEKEKKKKDENVEKEEEEEYLVKARGILEGEHAFRLEYRPGIVRKTPLAPRRTSTSSPVGGDFKIWAPSPRVRQQEPSKWLVEPELKMEYLGSTEEDDEKDENASTNEKKKKNDKKHGLDSPIATPPDTPSFGSPYHDGSVDHDIKIKQEEEDEEDEAKDEEGMEQSGGEEDVESAVDGPSDDEEGNSSSADRKRDHSDDMEDRSNKRLRRDPQEMEDDNDTADEDPTMGEGSMEDDEEEDDDGGQSTPESVSSPSRTHEDGDSANV